MRQLFPTPADDIDLAAAYAWPDGEFVRVNFAASVDGAVSVNGRSAGLSSSADKELFHHLRESSDVILVGAGTARAENYGGARTVDGRTPPVAVISRSLDLDPTARLFTDTRVPPIVVTCESAPAARRDALAAAADIIVAGEQDVDVAVALDALAARGLVHVVCEGGPHLFGWLLAARRLDELCLTIAPLLAGGTAGRIVSGLQSEVVDELDLRHVLEDSGHLFLRYAAQGPSR